MVLLNLHTVALLCLLPARSLAASSLLVSHFSGRLYSLGLSDGGQLTLTSQASGGARMPSWLTLDADSKTLYVTDEVTYGTPFLTAFSVGDGGALTQKAQGRTPGGELHSTLYGGADGKGFIAMAE
jgi:6-phosphogluconolactonase (cycloisomerase 2 family)